MASIMAPLHSGTSTLGLIHKPICKAAHPSSSIERTPRHPHPRVSFLKRREFIKLGLLTGMGINLGLPAMAEETLCELVEVPSGLAFCDRVVGAGPQAVKGQLVKAHYVGKLDNGTVFDSSYKRGQPLIFRVGVGEVIKGWDEGITGGDGIPPMQAGGKRVLKIPPELGYGMRGAGCRGGSCVIPPDSVLLFEVELLK